MNIPVYTAYSVLAAIPITGAYVWWNRQKLAEEFPLEQYGVADITATLCYRCVVNTVGTLVVVPSACGAQLFRAGAAGMGICCEELHWLYQFVVRLFDQAFLRRIWNTIHRYGSALGRRLEPPFRFIVRNLFYWGPVALCVGLLHYYKQ